MIDTSLFHDFFSAIEESVDIGGWWLDLIEDQLHWTDGTKRLHEVMENFQPCTASALSFYLPPYDNLLKDAVDKAINEARPYNLKAKFRTAKGNIRWAHAIGAPKLDAEKNVVAVYGSFKDITAETEKHIRMQSEEKLQQTAFDSLVEGLITIRKDGTIHSFNRAAEEIFGYDKSEIQGQPIEVLMPEPHRARHKTYVRNYETTGEAKIINVGREVQGRRRDGTVFPMHLSVNPIAAEHEADYIGTIRDLSKEKEVIGKLEWLSHYDEVTRLPNRTFLLTYLQEKISQAPLALLALDLSGFSKINHAHGFAEGNHVLKTVAERLTSVLPENCLVSHDLSDRFWIVLDQADTVVQAELHHYLEQILSTVSHPLQGLKTEHHLSASIGVIMTASGDTASTLMSNAEAALHSAKKKGRRQVCYFEQTLSDTILEEYRLERALRQALGNNEFQCWLQPQASQDITVRSAEVLIRWRNSDGTIIPPDKFIPIAERTGLIDQIGHFVVREAARMLASLHQDDPDFTLAINVSPREFTQPDFAQGIHDIFAEEGAPLSHLIIEITENLLLQDEDVVNATMLTLAPHGVRFSIDDFGTGYSNLKRIREIPVTELKIDRQFIRDLADNEKSLSLVQAMVSLAKTLDCQVVAEGVETLEIVDLCLSQGIDLLQGYYFSKPLPFEEFRSRFVTSKRAKLYEKPENLVASPSCATA